MQDKTNRRHSAARHRGASLLVALALIAGALSTTIAATTSPAAAACTHGTPGCPWIAGDQTTYIQAFWSEDATASGLLANNFSTVYADTFGTVELGIVGTSGFSMSFSDAMAVSDYLPALGASGPLTSDLLDPTSTSSGTFGGETLALALNVDFSDAAILPATAGVPLGDLRLCNITTPASVNGLSVRQLLADAETLLGGGTGVGTIFNTVVPNVNGSFGAGTPSTFAQEHLFNGPCPPYTLIVAPHNTTRAQGGSHQVTATVRDSADNKLPGTTVRFSVTGANTASGTVTTDVLGRALFTYTGVNLGQDTIHSYADSDGDSIEGVSEPGDNAHVTWVCTPAGTITCRWNDGDLTTYSQNGWGDGTSTPGTLLISNFNVVYPTGVEPGLHGAAGHSMLFSDAGDILNYLPASGNPAALTADLLDPSSTPSGEFGGDVLALHLDVDFADAGLMPGTSGLKLGDLTLCNLASLPALDGMTVRQFLSEANVLLGGGTSVYVISQMDPVASSLTTAFGGGTASLFAQEHLYNGACPPPPSNSASLVLAPATATRAEGGAHQVTATVRDSGGEKVIGASVRFSVSGANPISGVVESDLFGRALFTYIGNNLGNDTIHAYSDNNHDTNEGPSEPSGNATATWVCTPAGTFNCRWNHGDLTTYIQASWGNALHPPGVLLASGFDSVYGGGVEVGLIGSAGYSMRFTDTLSVYDYLPATGPTSALEQDLVNPSSSPSGDFGGNVLALKIDVDFSDAGLLPATSGLRFGDVTLCDMPGLPLLNGLTVRETLGHLNTVLGGGTGLYDIQDLASFAATLAGAFTNGTPSLFTQAHLFNGPCPNPSVTLSPKTITKTPGTVHTVTASAKSDPTTPTPAGTVVRFTVTGANPTSGAPTTDASGVATFSYTGANAGADAISAYVDFDNDTVADAGEPVDTAAATWVASSSTVLTSSVNPAMIAQPITLTATVSSSPTATGLVTFKDGTVTLGTGTLTGGVAHFTTPNLRLGSHALSAVYAGSPTVPGSTGTLTQQVVPAVTILTALPVTKTERRFTAVLLHAGTGAPLVGQTVVFSTDTVLFGARKAVCNAKTDNHGIASCVAPAATATWTTDQPYTAAYAGTAAYQPATTTGTVKA